MSTPRLHCDQRLAEGAEVPASPGQAHYLGSVMRRGPGDAVILFNAEDGEWAAEIAGLRKDRSSFRLGARRRPPEACPDTRLLLAALKRDAMGWAVEKATELGIGTIQPVLTRRSVAERANTERLGAIAREAAEQCERLSVPVIAPARPLPAVLDEWDGALLFVAVERQAAPPLTVAAQGLAPPWGLLVGPEGGFEPLELTDLRRRPWVRPVNLGPRILRAETAALAGLAMLQSLAGDWTAARESA
jgi:16S rRNA (uracil1498-N3)-methyltransferase